MVIQKFFKKSIVSKHNFNGWSFGILLFSLILIGPFVALCGTALGDSEGLWAHLIKTVL